MTDNEMITGALREVAQRLRRESKSRKWTRARYAGIRSQLRAEAGDHDALAARLEREGIPLHLIPVANGAAPDEREVRVHSSDDMGDQPETAERLEPVAVVIRPDGSVDAYGYVGIVDQRGADSREDGIAAEVCARCGGKVRYGRCRDCEATP